MAVAQIAWLPSAAVKFPIQSPLKPPSPPTVVIATPTTRNTTIPMILSCIFSSPVHFLSPSRARPGTPLAFGSETPPLDRRGDRDPQELSRSESARHGAKIGHPRARVLRWPIRSRLRESRVQRLLRGPTAPKTTSADSPGKRLLFSHTVVIGHDVYKIFGFPLPLRPPFCPEPRAISQATLLLIAALISAFVLVISTC